ncbi:NAD-dependent epimerase/dehydratase family protein [Aldersonia kunmingensis]|uniref:NAD-dependent epimerase/dehydratase family protein n=1 Tax=Aldersonia kunmingensis TaxID=408066 RepID=UPI00082EA176|nr:NAD-dependent epimerase/dehydratase family protein [Aldersonia kunmingensis]
MKVAVTGAAGFVGVNLVEQLLADGHEVVAIDRVRSKVLTAEGVTWVDADILDVDSMVRAFDGVEVVYHLVAVITLAHKDDIAWRVNTEGVRTVAEAALTVGARKLVHCSSLHAFDQYHLGSALNESSARATGADLPVYDRSKWQGEVELLKVADRGLDAVICNPTGIYGPADYGLSRMNAMLRDAGRGRMPVGIKASFDMVDVRDVAAGLILASEKGVQGENYLLTGYRADLTELFRIAARSMGRRGPLFALPLKALELVLPIAEPIGSRIGSDVFTKAAIETLLTSPVVDGSKAARVLGYKPRPTEETMRDFVTFLVGSGQMRG